MSDLCTSDCAYRLSLWCPIHETDRLSENVEDLARDLCDTYYLTVHPHHKMCDAYSKISKKTRKHWRAQATLLLEKGWRQ